MTDDLVKRLRGIAVHSYLGRSVIEEAADRIEQLTADRDRLREALEHIISDCEADYPPSHGAIKYAAKLALKGETP